MMKELKPIKEGKVGEIYDNGDSLIMVSRTPGGWCAGEGDPDGVPDSVAADEASGKSVLF